MVEKPTLDKEPLDLPMAPTLRPTEEEFRNPMEYVSKLKQQGYQKYGIVKIVPPLGWKPPFAINKQSFKFHTRVQAVNELQNRYIIAAKARAFKTKVESFYRDRGQKCPKVPVIYGQKISFFKLYSAVVTRGGYNAVIKNKKWNEVGRMVVPKHRHITNLSFLIRVAYEKSLLNFERYVEAYFNLDTTQLDTLLAACDFDTDQDKKPKEETTQEFSVKIEINEHAWKGNEGEEKEAATELQALDGLMDLGVDVGPITLKIEEKQPVRTEDIALANVEEIKRNGIEDYMVKDSECNKRRSTGEEAYASMKNSKEIDVEKIEYYKPYMTRNVKHEVESDDDHLNVEEIYCELCNGGAHEDQIILCDKCDKGFHTFCLAPPLKEIPKGEWTCPLCISSATDELAFAEGSEFSVEEFEIVANKFKTSWFASRKVEGEIGWQDVEREFWNIVEKSNEPVEVFYGADLDTGLLGSGFPHSRHGFTGSYADSEWNLNNLPKTGGEFCSMLRHVQDNIPGVIVPWLYMGMMFSSFCWHVEDHMFYSINYNHIGDPKIWYGVPSSSAIAFEDVFRKFMPEQFKLQPDLLFQLVTMLSPRILKGAGVPVYRVVQEEGSFVITFPRAYHGGFNSGFNCAEAVNFAPADWFEFGSVAVERYRDFRRSPVLSYDALLCKVCEEDGTTTTALEILKELDDLIERELFSRDMLSSNGVNCKKVLCTSRKPGPGFGDDDAECAICKQYMHLSACSCKCSPNYLVCLDHVCEMCTCSWSSKTLHYRKTIAELESLRDMVKARITSIDEKYEAETPTRVKESLSWMEEASPLIQYGQADLSQVNDLLIRAGKFTWGGRAMDKVRDCVSKLELALIWREEVAHCMSAKRRKLEHSYIKKVLSVNPRPLNLDLSRLEMWDKNAHEMNEKASKILDSTLARSFTMEEVSTFFKECQSFVIIIPLLSELSTAVRNAKRWVADVKTLLNKESSESTEKGPLSAINVLKNEGLSFLWKMQETQDLSDIQSKIEQWQDHARVILAKKASFEELSKLDAEGGAWPFFVPQHEEVQQLLKSAKKWIDASKEVDLKYANLKKLRQLLHNGVRIPVIMKEVDELRANIRRLEWEETFSRVLKSKSRPSVQSLDNLVKEGQALNLDEGNEYLNEAKCRLLSIQEWDIEAKQQMAGTQELHKLEILVESGNACGVVSDLLKSLAGKLNTVNSWKKEFVRKSSSYMNGEKGRKGMATLEELNKLQAKSDVFIEQTAEYMQLKDMIKIVIDWTVAAEKYQNTMLTISEINLAEEHVNSGMKMGIMHPQLAGLSHHVACMKWRFQANEFMNAKGKYADLCRLAIRGEALHKDNDIVLKLKEKKMQVDLLSEEVHDVISGQKEDIVTLDYLQSMRPAFDAIGVRTYAHVLLEKAMERLQGWLSRVQELADFDRSGNGAAYYNQVLLLKDAIVDQHLCSKTYEQEIELIHNKIGLCQAYLERCRKVLVKPGSNVTISKAVNALFCNTSELTNRFCAEPQSADLVLNRCLCRKQVQFKRGANFECRACKHQYHLKCFFKSRESAYFEEDELKSGLPLDGICCFCLAEMGISLPLWVLQTSFAVSSSHRITKMVPYEVLQDLVIEGEKAPCKFEYLDEIKSIVSLIQNVKVKLQNSLSIPKMAWPPTFRRNLILLLKDLLPFEIDVQLKVLIMRNLYLDQFLSRVMRILGKKPKLDIVQKLLDEAEYFHIGSTDIFQQLADTEKNGREWINLALNIIQDPQWPLEKAKAHLTAGQAIKIDIGDVEQDLSERCTLYCLCQTPYDQNRAMLACDVCDEWYHYECVGLTPPSDDAEGEDYVQEYICEKCRSKQATTYPQIENGTARESVHEHVSTFEERQNLEAQERQSFEAHTYPCIV